MDKELLKSLKGKVKSVDDLKEIAIRHGISFEEKDLEETFKALQNNEISDELLEKIDGGMAVIPTEYTPRSCYKCGKEIMVKYKSTIETRCEHCGTLNNYYTSKC